MIYFVTGEPGAGKSMYLTRSMIEDLVKGSAFVVTNEALVLPELRAYVCSLREKMGIEEEYDQDENLKWLPSEEVFEFWRHRSGGLVLQGSPDRKEDDEYGGKRRMPKEQFTEFMTKNFEALKLETAHQRPVHYYISETADYFDSQEWQTTGRAVKWYARKHRHLHDNVYLTAHNPDDVELRLRNLVSEQIDMVNNARRSVGWFKARPRITAQHYFKMKGGNKKPFYTESFEIDIKGIGACYKTAGALGVHQTPEANRNKGKLPWWLLPLAGAAGITILFFTLASLPFLGGKIGGKIVSGSLLGIADSGLAKQVIKPAGKVPSLNNGQLAIAKTPSEPETGKSQTNTVIENERDPARHTDKPFVTGYVVQGKRYNVILSDGSVRAEDDGTVKGAGRHWVDIEGVGRTWIRPVSVPGSPPEKQLRSEESLHAPAQASRSDQPAAAPTSNPAGNAIAQQQSGSWYTDQYGVQHLKDPPTLTPSLVR